MRLLSSVLLLVLGAQLPSVEAVLPFPLQDILHPLHDDTECIGKSSPADCDYSTDCTDRVGLCKNDAFKGIMHSKCARTCRICGEIQKDDDPMDTHRYKLGKRRRPVTADGEQKWLGRAADTSQQSADGSEEAASGSAEQTGLSHLILRPPTGPPRNRMRVTMPKRKLACVDTAPNCFYLRSLCLNRFYLPVMQENCKRTCNFCEVINPRPPLRRWLPQSWPTPAPTPTEACSNRGLDCDEKVHLCTHWRYWRLMRRICALSCGFCDPDY